MRQSDSAAVESTAAEAAAARAKQQNSNLLLTVMRLTDKNRDWVQFFVLRRRKLRLALNQIAVEAN